MKNIWQLLFIQPITQALFILTDLTGNLGVAIIVLTIVVQLVLLPLRLPSLRSAEKMKGLKPHLDDLKKKHKDDPQKLMHAQMELYKEHGVSPFGGILTLLLSFPIIIALYQVLQTAVVAQGDMFLWLNLAERDPYYILPVLVAVTQWLMTRLTMPDTTGGSDSSEDMAVAMQKNMQYIFPLMLGFITLQLPSGVGIYFVVSALFAIMQQAIMKIRSGQPLWGTKKA
jgi:YidC/Oxa1 family membrane protein insertase